ncbi:hypothetical protein ACFSTA_09485 [Ornithinibacillus salinisoli]|uniref:DUF3169 family protein n=1 Tax=Ornithinibacillus salinisoli TaxID=1848459 RepID=A0ABW4VY12_9BACI
MNKNDFRIQFPLWNITLYSILIICFYSIVRIVDLTVSNFEGVFTSIGVNWSMLPLKSFFIGFTLLIIFFIAYLTKLYRHNKENPKSKMYAFTVRPNEFLDDDEMLRIVTRNATKKVYILYVNGLPSIVLLMLLPLDRFVFIAAIFLLLIIQNALYYREIRQYLSGEYSLNLDYSKSENKKQGIKNSKLQKRLAIVVGATTLLFLTIGGIRILQVQSNHNSNMEKIESCLANEGNMTYEGATSIWGLSSVSCEID